MKFQVGLLHRTEFVTLLGGPPPPWTVGPKVIVPAAPKWREGSLSRGRRIVTQAIFKENLELHDPQKLLAHIAASFLLSF